EFSPRPAVHRLLYELDRELNRTNEHLQLELIPIALDDHQSRQNRGGNPSQRGLNVPDVSPEQPLNERPCRRVFGALSDVAAPEYNGIFPEGRGDVFDVAGIIELARRYHAAHIWKLANHLIEGGLQRRAASEPYAVPQQSDAANHRHRCE